MSSSHPPDPLVGAAIAHYRIESRLGAGGMGTVYAAEDTRLNRRVALKFLATDLAADDTFRARFVREARAIALLNHPNIVHIYEVSQHEGRPFYVMELIEGHTLRDPIGKGGMPLGEALRVGAEICDGLAAAHQTGMVHRDVKPGNILIDPNGRVKILDFGLAKRSVDADLTAIGQVAGTLSYMSPEQARGRDLDHRSDIFSFGVVFYEMLTGQKPFKRDNDLDTLTAIVNEPCPSIAAALPSPPPELSGIIDRLLAKHPDDRYQHSGDAGGDLRNLAASLTRPTQPKSQKPSGGSGKWIGTAVAVVVLSGAGIGTWYVMKPEPIPQSQRDRAVTPTQSPPAAQDTESTELAVASPAPGGSSADAVDTLPGEILDETAILLQQTLAQVRDSVSAARISVDTDDRQLPAFFNAARTENRADSLSNAGNTEDAIVSFREATGFYRKARNQGYITDTAAVHATIVEFWNALAQHEYDSLRAIFPDLPPAQEEMWRSFTRSARDLAIECGIEELRTTENSARTQISVTMDYRDARGTRSQNLAYIVRLSETDGIWRINEMNALQ